ncbi:MAG: phospholipase D-like domain-containing protein [Vulcanimicrobiaceae bacterium]
MITLASTGRVLEALRTSRDIACMAYALPSGPVLDGLESAARRGARVVVRLEGSPYDDAAGGLLRANAAAISALRSSGADARLVHQTGGSEPALHAKAIVAGGAIYLDDCNWLRGGGDTIVRDNRSSHIAMVRDAVNGTGDNASPAFALRKRDALRSEARVIDDATGARIDVESESVSNYNCVFHAIATQAKNGKNVRLLVSARDLRASAKERAALTELASDGVHVRSCPASEKFALDGPNAWVGSANASAAFDRPDQLDWGLKTRARDVAVHLRACFDQRWAAATPLGAVV